jgi:hypothetical protein
MKTLTFFCLSFFSMVWCMPAAAQTNSKYIVIDQFGYLPNAHKVAVIRDPQTGFDAAESFAPSANYAVVDAVSKKTVFTGAPVVWKGGNTDASSGDKAWWFDFSALTTPGSYFVLDMDKNVKSFEFEISPVVYNSVLRHAMRSFFYQRAGFAKAAQYAGTGWADGASHLGPLQDKNARPYNEKGNAAKEADVSGGWYDAGDLNRYTNWTASYVVDFLRTYREAPEIWTDDYNIPESGNGVPDILDEVRWGIDHLLRLQRADGSVLSIVSCAHASPPSSATEQSLYGLPSTSATLNTAAAFAFAAKIFGDRGATAYATQLRAAAINAWNWAIAHPDVLFKNNDAASGTSGIGAGQQETDDYGRFMAKMKAACFLFELTGEADYKTFIDSNYTQVHLIAWGWASYYESSNNEMLLHYTTLPGADATIANTILTTYRNALNTDDHFLAHSTKTDPYLAYINHYGWGSNSLKSLQGLIYTNLIFYKADPSRNAEAWQAAETYIHYIHGVNPLNMTYLSNMYKYGGDNCVNEFYHTWFTNGSSKWDRVGTSQYGPPPGFLSGGANPDYNWDGVCPGHAGCNSESITPPKGQPAQKSYKDFNTSWPLNSWEVTENSDGYQINYIRLLSKFIQAGIDCHGTAAGQASFDVCGTCAGGDTQVTPETSILSCEADVLGVSTETTKDFSVFPNPANISVDIEPKESGLYELEILTTTGRRIFEVKHRGNLSIPLHHQPAGIYILLIKQGDKKVKQTIIKQ